jgi:hypothetical protein
MKIENITKNIYLNRHPTEKEFLKILSQTNIYRLKQKDQIFFIFKNKTLIIDYEINKNRFFVTDTFIKRLSNIEHTGNILKLIDNEHIPSDELSIIMEYIKLLLSKYFEITKPEVFYVMVKDSIRGNIIINSGIKQKNTKFTKKLNEIKKFNIF